ncbi:MAG: hypothetical protein ABID54_14280 [Pseudomonadota bacterium]
MSDFMDESVIRGEEDRKELTEFLTDEINAIATGDERKGLEENWAKWRRQREDIPEMKSKDYPWANASNVVPPVVSTDTQGIYSVIKDSVDAKDPVWLVKSARKSDADAMDSVTEYFGAMAKSKFHLNLSGKLETILFDTVSLGTQFVKVPWIKDYWAFKKKDPSGGFTLVNKPIFSGPSIVPIRLEDFFTRPYWPDIQKSPWIAHRIHLTEHELRLREKNGIYQDVERVLKGARQGFDENKIEELAERNIEVDEMKGFFDIYEIYTFYDADGDGYPEDIVVFYEPETKTILREEYNLLGRRPIARFTYIKRAYQLYGIGVGWMLENMQDEITTLHNMRIDQTHISGLQMYATRLGGPIPENEEFRPLKQIPCDNPKEDIVPISFPDTSGATLQAEMVAKELANRRSGAGDYLTGFENKNIGTRATATGTMFLANRGASVIQTTMAGIRDSLSELGNLVLFQCVLHSGELESSLSLVDNNHAENVKRVFSMEVEDIPSRMSIQVQTADIDETAEARKQSKLTLASLYAMYAEKMKMLLPAAFNPEMPEEFKLVILKFYVGATKLMEDICKSFKEADYESYIPYVRDIERLVELQESLRAQSIGEGSYGGAKPTGIGGPGEPGNEG